MLDISEGITQLGEVRWQLALCLLLCWLTVFICLSKGIRSSGKVTYVTSVFPYLILVILLVRGLTLEGSTEGILYYLTPDFTRLASAKVNYLIAHATIATLHHATIIYMYYDYYLHSACTNYITA
jgi:solute carrier family 6 amino acid transporter-like protein 5/7/9/14